MAKRRGELDLRQRIDLIIARNPTPQNERIKHGKEAMKRRTRMGCSWWDIFGNGRRLGGIVMRLRIAPEGISFLPGRQKYSIVRMLTVEENPHGLIGRSS
jgi:hypothetical protein